MFSSFLVSGKRLLYRTITLVCKDLVEIDVAVFRYQIHRGKKRILTRIMQLLCEVPKLCIRQLKCVLDILESQGRLLLKHGLLLLRPLLFGLFQPLSDIQRDVVLLGFCRNQPLLNRCKQLFGRGPFVESQQASQASDKRRHFRVLSPHLGEGPVAGTVKNFVW